MTMQIKSFLHLITRTKLALSIGKATNMATQIKENGVLFNLVVKQARININYFYEFKLIFYFVTINDNKKYRIASSI
jgi:hypothetical protein